MTKKNTKMSKLPYPIETVDQMHDWSYQISENKLETKMNEVLALQSSLSKALAKELVESQQRIQRLESEKEQAYKDGLNRAAEMAHKKKKEYLSIEQEAQIWGGPDPRGPDASRRGYETAELFAQFSAELRHEAGD